MIKTINGRHYQSLIDYGIRNLTRHCDEVNDLNVFPVPDGDTGTNMVKTLQNGFNAIRGSTEELPALTRKFAKAVVFGARGNSGVIVAQFFKEFSEGLLDVTEADCAHIASALTSGVNAAYRAVAHPVEGTILTVLRESSQHVAKNLEDGDISNVNELISRFLEQAKRSLDNTPDLLPILKSAGVVDSGGAGILYIFEGMNKYLNGEPLAEATAEPSDKAVDYTRFNRSSSFEYGYCTEFLLQMTEGREPLIPEQFRKEISALGDSVVTAVEDDKAKVHVHTKAPEQVLSYAHRFGEFLTLKIENMSVQHSENTPSVELFTGSGGGELAVVAVAHDTVMRDLFLNMGADAVLAGEGNLQPSTKDFLKAYECTGAKRIFVFPNSKNSNLAALQAGGFYADGEVTVFDTNSVAQCYAALSMMDFEADQDEVLAAEIRNIIENIVTVSVTRATADRIFDGTSIEADDFVGFTGSRLLGVAKERVAVAVRVVETVLREQERNTITLFAGKNVPPEELDAISEYTEKNYPLTDLDVIVTENDTLDLLICFE